MKKILTHLTGIVFVITILIAGGCRTGDKQNDSTEEEIVPQMAVLDSTKVDVFLKATLLDGEVHLLMSDSKKPGCEVIDGLVTVVYPGYTVTWKKAKDSNINEIIDIQLVEADSRFKIIPEYEGVMRSFKLIIPPSEPDTIKYKIEFTVTWDTDTFCIDPYLRIPNLDQ